MNWTPKNEDKLRQYWMAVPVMSAAEIGRQMHVSKNAIVGKAHRLGLTPRESPIVRGSETRGPGRVRKGPVIAAGARGPVAPAPTLAMLLRPAEAAPEPVWTPADILPAVLPTRRCSWPLWGNHERPTHRYCDKPCAGMWCADCSAKGHVKSGAKIWAGA